MASILLIPDETLDSDNILNTPISPVLFTCVPPHNSTETSEKLKTLTSSSYFSPKRAIAPWDIASSLPINLVSAIIFLSIL